MTSPGYAGKMPNGPGLYIRTTPGAEPLRHQRRGWFYHDLSLRELRPDIQVHGAFVSKLPGQRIGRVVNAEWAGRPTPSGQSARREAAWRLTLVDPITAASFLLSGDKMSDPPARPAPHPGKVARFARRRYSLFFKSPGRSTASPASSRATVSPSSTTSPARRWCPFCWRDDLGGTPGGGHGQPQAPVGTCLPGRVDDSPHRQPELCQRRHRPVSAGATPVGKSAKEPRRPIDEPARRPPSVHLRLRSALTTAAPVTPTPKTAR